MKFGSMSALTARSLYPEFSYSLQDLSSGPCTCKESTPKKRPGIVGKFARALENPFNSVSSRKSILDSDVSAYDLIQSYVNSDDLNDNAVEEEGGRTKSDEWSVSSESPSSESGIFSQTPSIRVGGQGVRIPHTGVGNSTESPYWSESSEEMLFCIPEPDYVSKETVQKHLGKPPIASKNAYKQHKSPNERNENKFINCKSKPSEEFAKDARKEIAKLKASSKITQSPSEAPDKKSIPSKPRAKLLPPISSTKNIIPAKQVFKSKQLEPNNSSTNIKPKSDIKEQQPRQDSKKMPTTASSKLPSIQEKLINNAAKKLSNEKRKFATIAVRVENPPVKSILRKSLEAGSETTENDIPNFQQALALRKKKHVHFNSLAEIRANTPEPNPAAKKVHEEPSKSAAPKDTSEIRKSLPPPPPPPRISSVKISTGQSKDPKNNRNPVEIPRPSLKKSSPKKSGSESQDLRSSASKQLNSSPSKEPMLSSIQKIQCQTDNSSSKFEACTTLASIPEDNAEGDVTLVETLKNQDKISFQQSSNDSKMPLNESAINQINTRFNDKQRKIEHPPLKKSASSETIALKQNKEHISQTKEQRKVTLTFAEELQAKIKKRQFNPENKAKNENIEFYKNSINIEDIPKSAKKTEVISNRFKKENSFTSKNYDSSVNSNGVLQNASTKKPPSNQNITEYSTFKNQNTVGVNKKDTRNSNLQKTAENSQNVNVLKEIREAPINLGSKENHFLETKNAIESNVDEIIIQDKKKKIETFPETKIDPNIREKSMSDYDINKISLKTNIRTSSSLFEISENKKILPKIPPKTARCFKQTNHSEDIYDKPNELKASPIYKPNGCIFTNAANETFKRSNNSQSRSQFAADKVVSSHSKDLKYKSNVMNKGKQMIECLLKVSTDQNEKNGAIVSLKNNKNLHNSTDKLNKISEEKNEKKDEISVNNFQSDETLKNNDDWEILPKENKQTLNLNKEFLKRSEENLKVPRAPTPLSAVSKFKMVAININPQENKSQNSLKHSRSSDSILNLNKNDGFVQNEMSLQKSHTCSNLTSTNVSTTTTLLNIEPTRFSLFKAKEDSLPDIEYYDVSSSLSSTTDSVSYTEDSSNGSSTRSNESMTEEDSSPPSSMFQSSSNAISLTVESRKDVITYSHLDHGGIPSSPPSSDHCVVKITMDGSSVKELAPEQKQSEKASILFASSICSSNPLDNHYLEQRNNPTISTNDGKSVVVITSSVDAAKNDEPLYSDAVSSHNSLKNSHTYCSKNIHTQNEICVNSKQTKSKDQQSMSDRPFFESQESSQEKNYGNIQTHNSFNNITRYNSDYTNGNDTYISQKLNSTNEKKNKFSIFNSSKYISPFLSRSTFYDNYSTKKHEPLKVPSNNDTIYGIPIIQYPFLPRKENNGGTIRVQTFYDDIDHVREELDSRKSDSGYPESEHASPNNLYESVQEEENFYDVINDDLVTSDQTIYDDIAYKDIYEEIPDKLRATNKKSQKNRKAQPSIFQGASKDEILEYLKVLKERLVDSDISDFDETTETEGLASWITGAGSSSSECNSLKREETGVRPKKKMTPVACPDCRVEPLLEPGAEVCSKCHRKRNERKDTVRELVETEAKYGRDLQIMKKAFYDPIQTAGLLSEDQLSGVFLNIGQLIEVNRDLTSRLRREVETAAQREDKDLQTVHIGKMFLESNALMEAFESYCTRQGCASLLLTTLEKEKELLRLFLKVSQLENTLLRRMSLSAFLMVPVQRVTKYPLLLSRLYKTTPAHHPDKEALRQAQNKVELHLDHMNEVLSRTLAAFTHSTRVCVQKTKDSSGVKLWRRISLISSSPRRIGSLIDVGSIKLRKLALEALGWERDAMRVPLAGRVMCLEPQLRRRGFMLIHALLVTLGTPGERYRPDVACADGQMPPWPTGLTEAALILARERPAGRLALFREPILISRAVVAMDSDLDAIDLTTAGGKDWVLIKGETDSETGEWHRMLCYHARDLGAWRRRRNGLANIMMSNMTAFATP